MSFNVVDLIKDQMTDAVLQKAGGLLGADGANLSSGLSNAIPALLGGITGAGSAPGQETKLFDAVNQADDGLLNDFAGALSGDNSAGMVEQGSNVLSGLLGGGMMNNLTSVLSSASGMSRGGSSSLMGMLAPVILGVLKKKVLDGGLNAGGLMSMLNSQKSNIAQAMPSNLATQLQGVEGFAAFDGLKSDVANSVSSGAAGVKDQLSDAKNGAASSIDATAAAVSDTAEKTKSGMSKLLLPAIVALVLAWLAFTFLGKKDTAPAEQADAATETSQGADSQSANTGAEASVEGATEAASDTASTALTDAAAAAGVDMDAITGDVTGLFDQASETLGGITDLDSATAAVPGLEALGETVSGLPDMFDKVPEAARGPLQGIVGEGLGSLQPILDTVLAIPGVGNIVEPIIGPMLETLSGLAG